MERNLIMAVLAIDAYNQGYNPGLATVGAQIGNATVTKATQDTDVQSVSASFAAVAYNFNGETIISYRGTDDIPADFWTGLGGTTG